MTHTRFLKISHRWTSLLNSSQLDRHLTWTTCLASFGIPETVRTDNGHPLQRTWLRRICYQPGLKKSPNDTLVAPEPMMKPSASCEPWAGQLKRRSFTEESWSRSWLPCSTTTVLHHMLQLVPPPCWTPVWTQLPHQTAGTDLQAEHWSRRHPHRRHGA